MLNPLVRKRTERATATLPQTAAGALFTITGGRIVVTQIIGEVTVAIQNQANDTQLTHDPPTGTTTNLCADLNIANDEVGTLYGMTGVAGDAMIGTGQTLQAQTRDVVLKPGSILLDCAASNTGSVKWTLFWAPLDAGAYVTTA